MFQPGSFIQFTHNRTPAVGLVLRSNEADVRDVLIFVQHNSDFGHIVRNADVKNPELINNEPMLRLLFMRVNCITLKEAKEFPILLHFYKNQNSMQAEEILRYIAESMMHRKDYNESKLNFSDKAIYKAIRDYFDQKYPNAFKFQKDDLVRHKQTKDLYRVLYCLMDDIEVIPIGGQNKKKCHTDNYELSQD